jgi:hypothetical protein
MCRRGGRQYASRKMFNTSSLINVHQLVSPPAGLWRWELVPRFHDPNDVADRWALGNCAVRKANGLIRVPNMECWRENFARGLDGRRRHRQR